MSGVSCSTVTTTLCGVLSEFMVLSRWIVKVEDPVNISHVSRIGSMHCTDR